MEATHFEPSLTLWVGSLGLDQIKRLVFPAVTSYLPG
jgi:hypothetical protein